MHRLLLWSVFLVVPLFAQLHPNPEFRDLPVVPFFHQHNSEIVHFTTLFRAPAGERHDLLLVRAGEPRQGWSRQGNIKWWERDDLLGVFLQSRENQVLVYELAILSQERHGAAPAVERLTQNEIVLSLAGEKDAKFEHIKLSFDVFSKKLLGQSRYRLFKVTKAVTEDGVPHFVAENGKSFLVLRPDDAGAGLELLPGEAAEKILSRFPKTRSTVRTDDGLEHFVSLDHRYFESLNFGPNNQFVLQTEKGSFGPSKVIAKKEEGGLRRFPLPQSTPDEFRRARPQAAGPAFSPEQVTILEEIGPHQLFESRLWLGKTFYDSEGMVGVGAFGYFDPAAEEFSLLSPPEIRNWSVSALLVERDTVWLGLFRRGEYGNAPGGLLAWDRRQERVSHREIDSVIHVIARYGGRLYLGTAEGISIVANGEVESYFVDIDAAGNHQVSRRNVAAQR